MNNLKINLSHLVCLVLLVVIIGISGVSASENKKQEGNTNITLHFFYDLECGACEMTLPYIDEYRRNHSEIIVEYCDITSNQTNISKFETFKKEYGKEDIFVPVVFVEDTIIEGNEKIIKDLDETIKKIAVTKTE